MAINATNRVHQCVFYPLSYWIHGGAAGDEYIWLFPTSAAMLDHPTRHAPPHMSCGRRWRTGRASGPYSSRRPRGWSALILYGRYGLIGRLSVSPIQIVWGFPPYVLYGQTSAYFQKWTGGGKTTQQESTCLTPRSVPERSAGLLLAREVRKTSLRAAAKWPKRLCLSSAPVLKVNLK